MAEKAETVDQLLAARGALRMIREAVGELFGPRASIESEEAVLLRGPEFHHEAEAIIDALKRVADAPPAPISEAVAVKPLEWKTDKWLGIGTKGHHSAKTVVGRYGVIQVITGNRAGKFTATFDGYEVSSPHATSDEAKAAAQADYETRIRSALVASPPAPTSEAVATYQTRVHEWMMACFNDEIAFSRQERNHRFLEEALELAQAMGCTRREAEQLVAYTYDRPIGEPMQEVGGVMVCLAALCTAASIDMDTASEAELARIWTKVEKIRAKHAAKPQFSPLPGPSRSVLPAPTTDAREIEFNVKEKLRMAFRRALSALPEIAPAEIASVLSSVHMQDEFQHEGKRLQREYGTDAVAPRVEQECGAGAWSFMRQGVLSALTPVPTAREEAIERPDWSKIYANVAHTPDRDRDDQELVTVTRETARLALSAINSQMAEEAYHNFMAAAGELGSALKGSAA